MKSSAFGKGCQKKFLYCYTGIRAFPCSIMPKALERKIFLGY